jgi:protoheme IX farnesyltransferase
MHSRSTATRATSPRVRSPAGSLARLLRHSPELAKARLNSLILFSALVGFLLGSVGSAGGVDGAILAWTLLGTALAAGGSAIINQWMERDRDALMERTRNRPLPSGAVSPRSALIAGVSACILGTAVLALRVHPITGVLALAVILIYVFLYTPLKIRTPFNTLVGAICGAIPPMIGWSAAAGALEPGAWVLAAVIFLWQIPHFLSLAWLYRSDYRRGGYRMLPVLDESGHFTSRVLLAHTLALLPVPLALVSTGHAGTVYGAGSTVLGLGLLTLGLRLYRVRSSARARSVFLASLAYLPLLLGLLVADRRAEPPLPPWIQRIEAARLDTRGIEEAAAETVSRPVTTTPEQRSDLP